MNMLGAGEVSCSSTAGTSCNLQGWQDLADRVCGLISDALQAVSDWWNA
jgi:hypothetical protein